MSESNMKQDVSRILGKPKITFILGKSVHAKANCCCEGGPASGKGTQASKLVEEFGYKHLTVGGLIRAEISKVRSPLPLSNNFLLKHCDIVQGTKLGNEMKNTVAAGNLINFKVTNKLVM